MKANFNPFPEIRTERLVLKQLTSSDAGALATLRSLDSVNRYLDRAKTQTVAEAQGRIEYLNQMAITNSGITWSMALATNQDLIGTVCLFNFSAEKERAELGYELHPDFQGKGLMTDAVAAAIDYAFQTMGAKEIVAFTHQHNQASLKLLSRFKFSRNLAAEKQIGKKDLGECHVYSLYKP